MTALVEGIHADLTPLLQGLSSADNNVRTQAEQTLQSNWVDPRPELLLLGLVEQMRGAQENVRSFAAVVFRRIASKTQKDPIKNETKELFLTLQSNHKTDIRAKLIECLTAETNKSVRKKTSDAIAEIARQYTDDEEPWPELLGALFTESQSADAARREGAFRIFATTPRIIEKQHEENVLNVFKQGFKDTENNVQIAAMEAFAAFFATIGKKAQAKYYSLLPELLNVMPPLKESQNQDQLSGALMALIDLAELAPKMFRPLFHNLLTFSISVIQEKELGDQTRQNALELMATFADYAPAMCKKENEYTTEMVTQCLSLMTDIGQDDEDASDWNENEDQDSDESDSNHVAGEQCMDRLANKLGGVQILPPTFAWLPRMMTSAAWRDRHAALMAISAISEGCRDLMVPELAKVLELVIPSLKDPHPRVRWAGCNAIGQMSTDFQGVMQDNYHQIILSNIVPVLDSPEPRVQSHAAAALVNFCEDADKGILEQYLDNILNRLLHLLSSPKRYVQEQALSTIATVADSAESAFSKYYDTLMPLLFNVLRGEQSTEFRLLRAKAMECATLIAWAVGKERVGADAAPLCQILANIQQGITESDDPQAQYLMHCWGRMCRILGKDFVPYLSGVLPPLLEAASANADVQILEDDDQAAQIDADEGWELVPLKGKYLGIKTAALEDKFSAIDLLGIYADNLGDAFDPFVSEIMEKVVIKGLKFYFHDAVRLSAAKVVPKFLSCVIKAHGIQSTQTGNFWAAVAPIMLDCLATEINIENLGALYEGFYQSIEQLGKCLDQAQQVAFVEAVRIAIKDYKERVETRLADSADREEGEEVDEDTAFEIEYDQDLLSDMNKTFHIIFRNHGSEFLPHWDSMMDVTVSFLSSTESTQRQWALCIMDDVLEFCGDQSFRYSQHFMKPLIDGCQDTDAANRQAAAYGVGVAAAKGGQAWAEFVAQCLPVLFAVTRMPNARDEDNVYATENACASIGKILHYNSSKVPNVQEITAHWIDTLPVTHDDEAAPYSYLLLKQLIDQRNPAVLSQPAKIIVYIVQALHAQALKGVTATKVVEAGKVLLQAGNVNLGQIMENLSQEAQPVFQSAFA
ncbi:MAG: hypothetical protein M1814_005744 [Vezdaea aestivalis]|nr:MAG: hypothetical protein M1814_005744 [Vezdaea aestivalis]